MGFKNILQKEGKGMFQFDTIEKALEDLRQGKIILVTDDPDRENEGDLSVPQNLRLQRTLILWQCMAKG